MNTKKQKVTNKRLNAPFSLDVDKRGSHIEFRTLGCRGSFDFLTSNSDLRWRF